MKRPFVILLAGLLLVATPPSLAIARDHDRNPRDHRGRHSDVQRGFDRDHDRHRHRHHSYPGVLGWGLAGLAVGGILLSLDAPAPPVAIAVPPPRPPVGMWYFCDAYGAYYPYVGQCPGGWRAVPAH